MSEQTGISWTDHTFNPWWGCAKVSPGCNHCYAETLADRYGQDVWGKTAPRRIFGAKHWAEPLAWNRKAEREGVRRRVFCASMADVFEDHPTCNAERPRLWDLIVKTPALDWQVLTKRPENVRHMSPPDWFANAWLGVSVEDQQRAEERVPLLLSVPNVPVRFLSVEPLIGPVALSCHWLGVQRRPGPDLPMVDWVIIGGESGKGHRDMRPEWFHKVASHVWQHGVPLFTKQDSGPRPGFQGRIPNGFWERKEFPQ